MRTNIRVKHHGMAEYVLSTVQSLKCCVPSRVAWLPAWTERKDKSNQKDHVCIFQDKRKQGKQFFGPHIKGTIWLFSVCSAKASDGERVITLEHIAPMPLLVLCWPSWKISGCERKIILLPVNFSMPFGLKPHLYWPVFWWLLMVFSEQNKTVLGFYSTTFPTTLPHRTPRRLRKPWYGRWFMYILGILYIFNFPRQCQEGKKKILFSC